jgi:hypothetical protein
MAPSGLQGRVLNHHLVHCGMFSVRCGNYLNELVFRRVLEILIGTASLPLIVGSYTFL